MLSLLRWGVLLTALAIALLSPGSPSTAFYILFGTGLVYNISLTVISVLLPIPPRLSRVIAVLDFVLFSGLAGTSVIPLHFLPFFPILAISLRWGLSAGLGAAALASGAFAAFYYTRPFLEAQIWSSIRLSLLLWLTGTFFLTAVLGGVLGPLERKFLLLKYEEELRNADKVHRRSQALYKLATTLGSTLNYQRVLEATLYLAIMGFSELETPSETLVGMVLLFEDDELKVAIAKGLTPSDEKVRVLSRKGLLARSLAEGKPVVTQNVKNDPELKAFSTLRQALSAIAVPLKVGFEAYGFLIIASYERGVFTREHVEFLEALSAQATVALQNALLYQKLKEERDRLVDAEEEARKKLARDLHDGPIQSVASIAMRLNYSRLLMDQNPDKVKEELRQLEADAYKTARELRTLLFTLRPVTLETQGLIPALEQFINHLRETEGLSISMETKGLTGRRLGAHREEVIFSILEEAINNARKHSQAKHISIYLEASEGFLIAEVQDDGVGFDIEEVERGYEQRGHMGLLNMRERAKLIDATLTIESAPGQGTRVILKVPIPAEEDSESGLQART